MKNVPRSLEGILQTTHSWCAQIDKYLQLFSREKTGLQTYPNTVCNMNVIDKKESRNESEGGIVSGEIIIKKNWFHSLEGENVSIKRKLFHAPEKKRFPIAWRLNAESRIRWIKVARDKVDKQGVNDEVIWWPGMVYEDHSEMMSDIHDGEYTCHIY